MVLGWFLGICRRFVAPDGRSGGRFHRARKANNRLCDGVWKRGPDLRSFIRSDGRRLPARWVRFHQRWLPRRRGCLFRPELDAVEARREEPKALGRATAI